MRLVHDIWLVSRLFERVAPPRQYFPFQSGTLMPVSVANFIEPSGTPPFSLVVRSISSMISVLVTGPRCAQFACQFAVGVERRIDVNEVDAAMPPNVSK